MGQTKKWVHLYKFALNMFSEKSVQLLKVQSFCDYSTVYDRYSDQVLWFTYFIVHKMGLGYRRLAFALVHCD